MNLEYIKVSLFEISYQKTTFSRCTCICELSVYVLSYLKNDFKKYFQAEVLKLILFRNVNKKKKISTESNWSSNEYIYIYIYIYTYKVASTHTLSHTHTMNVCVWEWKMAALLDSSLKLVVIPVFLEWKMAARTTDAAASLSPNRTVFSCFLSCKSQCFCTYSSRLPVFKRAYSREFLLDVGRTTFLELNSAHAEELRDLGLLRRPTPSLTPTTASRPQRRRYKRRERKQKRGKRGGIRARLAANPHKPAILSIVLANVRSLDNKLDHIRLLRSTQRTVRDCCVFVFTETWLNNSVPDCAIQLEQLTCYRADRALVEGGKRRGGGLCVTSIMYGAATLLWSANTAHPWWNLWLLSAGRSIYRGNIQPYCSLLYTSLPALTTITGVRHWMICTSTSVGSRQPTQMLFSSWLETLITQT